MKLTKITLWAAFPDEELAHRPTLTGVGVLDDLANRFAEQLRIQGAVTAACEWDEHDAPHLTDDTDIDVLLDALTAPWPASR